MNDAIGFWKNTNPDIDFIPGFGAKISWRNVSGNTTVTFFFELCTFYKLTISKRLFWLLLDITAE